MNQLEQEKTTEVAQIGRGGDCPTCGWLHGFHDPILHSYHDVPKWLTWKPGQLAPWEEPEESPVKSFGCNEEINKAPAKDEQLLKRKPAPLIVSVPVEIEDDEVANTLSVLKGLTADDLF